MDKLSKVCMGIGHIQYVECNSILFILYFVILSVISHAIFSTLGNFDSLKVYNCCTVYCCILWSLYPPKIKILGGEISSLFSSYKNDL